MTAAAPAKPRSSPPHRGVWQRFRAILQVFAAMLAITAFTTVWSRITNDSSPLPECLGSLAFAGLALHACVAERASTMAAIRQPVGLRHWLHTALAFGALIAFVEVYFWAAAYVFEILPVLAAFREHGWPPWSAVVLVVACPAICEELLFRGFLLTRLIPLLGRRDAWLLQGTLFAIIHLSPAMLPSHFVAGLVLGHLRLRTGSLLPGMAVHAAWNLTVTVQEGLLTGW